MTERELQIQKIHQLLRSNDEALVNLAFQLIESHFSFEEVFNQNFPIEEMEYDAKVVFEESQENIKKVIPNTRKFIEETLFPLEFKKRCYRISENLIEAIIKLNEIKIDTNKIHIEIIFGEQCKVVVKSLLKNTLIKWFFIYVKV